LPGSVAGKHFGAGSADRIGNRARDLLGVLDFDSI
jgi:hypothetical protein